MLPLLDTSKSPHYSVYSIEYSVFSIENSVSRIRNPNSSNSQIGGFAQYSDFKTITNTSISSAFALLLLLASFTLIFACIYLL